MAVLGNFVDLSQTSRVWVGMASDGTNVYACVTGGRIYYQVNGSGNFIEIPGQTVNRNWYAVHVFNSVIYAADYNGRIYTLAVGATGDFAVIAAQTTNRTWTSLTDYNGNVYASIQTSGKIYYQIGGSGDFIEVPGQTTNRSYDGLGVGSLGVYAGERNNDVYLQSLGSGDFNLIYNSNLFWHQFAWAAGDVFAVAEGAGIFKQTAGAGNFVLKSGTAGPNWLGLVKHRNFMYGCVLNGSIYKATFTADHTITSIDPSTFISNGALLRIYGTNLQGGSTTEITIDGVDYSANIVSASATEITFTAPRISSGLHYLVVIADSIESDSYSISYADQVYSAREYPCVSGSASWTLLMWYQCNQTAWGTVARIGDLDVFIGSPASNGTIGLGNNSVNIKASGVFLDNNSWHLIAIVNDNGTCKIGVDNGALSSTFTAPSGHSSMASKYSLKIGGNKTFNTYDVRLYNKALTAEQIDYYYDETLKTNPSFWEY